MASQKLLGRKLSRTSDNAGLPINLISLPKISSFGEYQKTKFTSFRNMKRKRFGLAIVMLLCRMCLIGFYLIVQFAKTTPVVKNKVRQLLYTLNHFCFICFGSSSRLAFIVCKRISYKNKLDEGKKRISKFTFQSNNKI